MDIVSLRASGTDMYGDGLHFLPDGDSNAHYYIASGTSMATPHVTGLAALLKSQDESRDWIAIKNLILAGGDNTPAMNGSTISSYTPVQVSGINAATSVAGGDYHSMALVTVFTIATSSLPAATLNTVYNQSLYASGGVAPYTWSLAAGSSLPPGLASDGEVIESQAVSLSESLLFDRPVLVTWRGGYDSGYAGIVSTTTIKGTLIISAGIVEIENIVLE